MIPRWTPVRRALVLLAMAAIAVLPATAGATVFPETIRLPDGFQPEGIAAAKGGRVLVVVQSNTGRLFKVNPSTGVTRQIDLGGALLGRAARTPGRMRRWE